MTTYNVFCTLAQGYSSGRAAEKTSHGGPKQFGEKSPMNKWKISNLQDQNAYIYDTSSKGSFGYSEIEWTKPESFSILIPRGGVCVLSL